MNLEGKKYVAIYKSSCGEPEIKLFTRQELEIALNQHPMDRPVRGFKLGDEFEVYGPNLVEYGLPHEHKVKYLDEHYL